MTHSPSHIHPEGEASRGVFLERFAIGHGPFSVAVKDVADIKGYPTRMASAAFEDAVPAEENAEIVDRILTGGAMIVGKTNMHELAYGVTGLNQLHGTPINPRFPALIPGGSSSGSAVAVAGGFCDASIGTDTGGSIRVPAACCGVLGLKPTYARVSRVGFTPQKSSLDCAGAFARNADALDKVMGLIAPDWTAANDLAPKIKWLKSNAEHEISFAVRSKVLSLQPDLQEVVAASFDDAHRAGLTIIAAETYAAFGHLIKGGRVDSEVASRLARAESISQLELQAANGVRAVFTAEIDALLEDCDVLALPTLAGYPPELDAAEDLMSMVEITSLCRPFNLSGHPAISIPLHPLNGRPVSLQLVAAKGGDEYLVKLASQYEQVFSRKPSAQGAI